MDFNFIPLEPGTYQTARIYLTRSERQALEEMKDSGRYDNLSAVVTHIVREYLKQNGGGHGSTAD